MRLGLAGTGRIGSAHADILKQLPGVSSVVVADVDTERARATAAKLEVDAAGSIDELFTSGVDGVVIAAATHAHPELIIRAVHAGLPVFCEKPVAGDVAGTQAVVDQVAEAEVPVQIGFQRRFDAGYLAARRAVTAGELGWLHTLRATTLDPAPPPAEYVPGSGGLFRDCGVHDFDIIRWVTGREVTEVYATGSNRGAEFFAAAGDVDTAAVLLTLDDDSLATVSLTRYNAAGYDVRLEVLGSAGSIAVGLDERLPLTSVEEGVTWPTGPAYPGFMERFRASYVRELEAFTEVVAGRIPSPCTVGDALAAFRIAEACAHSLRTHRPTPLPT
ncbi:Gfo/Idh/MocA family oxidoreductase [Saccharothrix sp. AJ9571]|nr:Gfo/Idh/MocA family oxidoreductase [Saccharothrix sp. AJ9571]